MTRLSLKTRSGGDKKTPSKSQAMPEPTAMIRVSKLMSERGMCSRREADDYIAKGWVLVNGSRVQELGTRAPSNAKITLTQRGLGVNKVTILINKPIGYVSGQAENDYKPAIKIVKPDNQSSDDRSKKTFIRQHLQGLAPAGRIDNDSTGLPVLTQDGRIAKQIIAQDTETEKESLIHVSAYIRAIRLEVHTHG